MIKQRCDFLFQLAVELSCLLVRVAVHFTFKSESFERHAMIFVINDLLQPDSILIESVDQVDLTALSRLSFAQNLSHSSRVGFWPQ
jgi:hypothetical protein